MAVMATFFLRATPRIGEHGYGYGKSWRGNALWLVLGEIEICLLIMTITTEWEDNKSRTLGQESERGKGRDWVQTRVFATLRILGRHGMHLTSSSKTPSTRPSCHEEHRTGSWVIPTATTSTIKTKMERKLCSEHQATSLQQPSNQPSVESTVPLFVLNFLSNFQVLTPMLQSNPRVRLCFESYVSMLLPGTTHLW